MRRHRGGIMGERINADTEGRRGEGDTDTRGISVSDEGKVKSKERTGKNTERHVKWTNDVKSSYRGRRREHRLCFKRFSTI